MKAKRLLSLPPYLFEDLENRCREAASQGRDVIDLSVGDPDLSPPDSIINHLKTALAEDRHHLYPPQRGTAELKASIRGYLKDRCGVEPSDDEILILIGSKEGIAHLPLAVCNPGDTVLVPDPGYPVYTSTAQFAGCAVDRFVLEERRRFLPDFKELATRDLSRARLLFLNYPNNPTSATATDAVFDTALRFGDEHGFVVANDAAYADVYFDDRPPPLLCAQPRALESPMIEFFSFSKTFCVTGWRVGFAVGNRAVIDALAHLKANIDSGVFGAIQAAAAKTLETDGDRYAGAMRATFEKRRDLALESLGRLGFHCFPTYATFYVWTRVPGALNTMNYALDLLDKTDVLVTPGTGFGDAGEGYFRIALTQPDARIEEAVARIAALR
ncbi:MAG: aminotransferase class I/II-fold pyridoxal phosphate-dependent enzyme [Candidatus Latescibacterota bacterium]|nr:MAG: aminotransferase class I/II-fold pyridoxal phosphate-dependent enzyme [Candidatus Latescibacterota bacterium]